MAQKEGGEMRCLLTWWKWQLSRSGMRVVRIERGGRSVSRWNQNNGKMTRKEQNVQQTYTDWSTVHVVVPFIDKEISPDIVSFVVKSGLSVAMEHCFTITRNILGSFKVQGSRVCVGGGR